LLSPRVTRFAPSPTGLLHVGHAYAVMQLEQWATQHHASIILRMEDIDTTRCRPEWSQEIIKDLQYFGFNWHGAVRQQSQHLDDYHQALESLSDLGVIYPCFCTRKSMHDALQTNVPVEFHQYLLNKLDAYPQICRHLGAKEQHARMQSEAFSWRLNCEKANHLLQHPVTWSAAGKPRPVDVLGIGDVVLARKDIGTSYHMAVVVDDAIQGVSDVVRGEDLCASTPLHAVLQQLLGLPSPTYHHHRLLRHANDQRLAKSQQSISLKHLREAGLSCQHLRRYLHACEGVWNFLPDDSPSFIAQQLGSQP